MDYILDKKDFTKVYIYVYMFVCMCACKSAGMRMCVFNCVEVVEGFIFSDLKS